MTAHLPSFGLMHPGVIEKSALSESKIRGDRLALKRILLADDHVEMLEEVRALLNQDYEIVGAVENGEKLVNAAQELKPDLIVSDISMPVMTGFEVAGENSRPGSCRQDHLSYRPVLGGIRKKGSRLGRRWLCPEGLYQRAVAACRLQRPHGNSLHLSPIEIIVSE